MTAPKRKKVKPGDLPKDTWFSESCRVPEPEDTPKRTAAGWELTSYICLKNKPEWYNTLGITHQEFVFACQRFGSEVNEKNL